jgi:2-oxoglutarate ferredoxin oxidoreductase subunit alpha
LAFVPEKDTVIKVNSYEHDESGIATEDPKLTKEMQDKRLRKEKYLTQDLERYEAVKVYNDKNSSSALLCWGSNKGPCLEVAKELGLKVIQPIVLHPFPAKQFKEALIGVKRLICVENNATGQLSRLLKTHEFKVDDKILKYDGRPFSADELAQAVREVLR